MNSLLPGGRLAGRLEALPREQIWLGITAALASIASLDCILPIAGFASLYIPVICGACWGLGARAGYLVAAIAALLSVTPALAVSAVAPDIVAMRTAIRIAIFLFLAATIASFRRSYDRELFLADRDRMTGTLNKEVFHRRCNRSIQDAAHSRHTLLLIILDLDDFKAVNNHGGHQAGDEVIRHFAEGASAIMRREDLIGRIGGDEFSLLVRVPSVAEGWTFARNVHKRLSAVLAESRYPVTCSMGALLIPGDLPRNASELMHAADLAMYRAKKAGKNAVEIARADVSRGDASVPLTSPTWKGTI
uniref:diguanylate cyclase n=1 Tax=Sphingomonas sp. JE1 TaxID=1628059 RepID=A0A0D4ZZG0_9SPHN|nr:MULTISPECIES: GGDEF domain-containing protein [unclassified Sphingomonas]AJW29637.1 diguanylate cyclase/phosphodiesterase with PAS/PAC sensor(s) [Sphingomonas sp. JE1]